MNSIAAGIVLYNPELDRLKENITSIANQVSKVIVVDNGSSNINEIKEEVYKYKNIIFIDNKINKGIAKALNQILGWCKENKFRWVLTLDQDTVCPLDLIEKMSKYIDRENIAIISPKIIDRNFETEDKYRTGYEYIEKAITSASLTNVDICDKVNNFDEKMFIDYVDFDLCTRLRKENYKILRLNEVNVLHELGNSKTVNFFGKRIIVYNHKPIRKYYYTRNHLYYINKHKDYINVKKEYANLFKRSLVTIIFEEKKAEKIRQIFKGIIDSKKMS